MLKIVNDGILFEIPAYALGEFYSDNGIKLYEERVSRGEQYLKFEFGVTTDRVHRYVIIKKSLVLGIHIDIIKRKRDADGKLIIKEGYARIHTSSTVPLFQRISLELHPIPDDVMEFFHSIVVNH